MARVTLSDPAIAAAGSGERAERRRGEAQGREFIALVTAIMASGAVAIDLMIPAFPDMREEFGMAPDSTQVGWSITVFFLGMAIGPWLYGPASDRFGRRRPLYAGMSLYVVSALVAGFATSWPMIIVARFVWGLGTGAPRSLSIAMIRDRHEGDQMARLMSMIMAVFLVVPIIAPAVGAGLIAVLPWRSVYWAPAVFMLGLMLWARRLPETLPVERRRPFTWRSVGQAGREVLSHRETVSFTIAITFLFGVMTTYLAGSEIILEEVYGYGEWFPLFFGVIAVLLAVNSLNNARLVQHLGLDRLVRRMATIGVVTSLVLLAVSLTNGGVPNFWVFTAALACVVPIAQGLTPNCNTAAMTPLPHVAGTASAMIATITTAGGALLGGVAGAQFDGTVRPVVVAITCFICVAAAFILRGPGRRPARSPGA